MTITTLPADPEGKNDERALWAGHAISAFARLTGMDRANEDNATILGDLLGDILHWCDRNGVDFATALHNARDHYAEETRAD
jgi:hypothetical protein